MKIQFGHRRDGNFQELFYAPLRENFPEVSWIFPHEKEDIQVISEQSLKKIDVFLAEVRDSATGLWIELGFSKTYGKRIICMYTMGSHISSSLRYITDEFVEYSSQEDMLEKLRKIL